MRVVKLAISLIVLLTASAARGEDRAIEGRVIDADGKPVPDATISPFWRANGSPRRPDGSDYVLTEMEQNRQFWGNVGKMEPWQTPVEADADGRFKITLPGRKFHLMAMDSSRRHGGIVELPDLPRIDDLTIKLQELVEVSGSMESKVADKKTDWTHVYVELLQDETRPLAMRRLVSCGSYGADFSFRLPPGAYQLEIYGNTDAAADRIDLRADRPPKLVIDGSQTRIDLGVIDLTEARPGRAELEQDSRDSGRWRSQEDNLGNPAPRWHAIDARRIDLSANVGDFEGKWLMIYFWGLGCAPCLAEGVPRMIDFYEDHRELRDQFEIVGVCIDLDGDARNLKQIDESLEPIIKHVWMNRRIEFPVVLDNTFKTWERFGIAGLGSIVLIDPEGRIREGDQETLRRILGKHETGDE